MAHHIIYIVDDDDTFQFVTKKAIKFAGIARQTLSFSDGEKAIFHLRSNKESEDQLPDIILLDLNMPFMDGWEFLDEYARLKSELCKEPYIYIVTSSSSSSDRHKAEEIPEVYRYMVKPVTPQHFREIHHELSSL